MTVREECLYLKSNVLPIGTSSNHPINEAMQTILGAGGTIAKDLARELTAYTQQIRLVSRNPQKINGTDQLFPADLTQREAVFQAVAGSKVVYLTVGFEYDSKVWRKNWPALMQNVIEACKQHQAKLVFFDNIYMYDRNYLGHLTEETPIRPTSQKGEVRARIAQMLLDEVQSGNLTALIARSADFYGPDNQKSILFETIYKNFQKGKKANWLADVTKKHSFTYTPDAARATALLGNTPDAFNQVWHLPTAANPLTGKQWIELFAKEMGVEPKYSVIPPFMMRLLGVFIPIMRELHEMVYQYDREYVFDSTKFEKRFSFRPTPYPQGVKQSIQSGTKDFDPRARSSKS